MHDTRINITRIGLSVLKPQSMQQSPLPRRSIHHPNEFFSFLAHQQTKPQHTEIPPKSLSSKRLWDGPQVSSHDRHSQHPLLAHSPLHHTPIPHHRHLQLGIEPTPPAASHLATTGQIASTAGNLRPQTGDQERRVRHSLCLLVGRARRPAQTVDRELAAVRWRFELGVSGQGGFGTGEWRRPAGGGGGREEGESNLVGWFQSHG
jgi:hypothetical protein